jgi:uncharacterized membrane protein YoaK (UPF0700 family)
MFAWAIRGIMIIVGIVTSWFVTRDSPQFGVFEMAVALLLIVLVVAILAFWPERWTHFLNRVHRPR